MNLTVYVPKRMEIALRRRAEASGQTPSLFVQKVVERELDSEAACFSKAFARLAGSWEDERDADAIIADLRANRSQRRREPLR